MVVLGSTKVHVRCEFINNTGDTGGLTNKVSCEADILLRAACMLSLAGEDTYTGQARLHSLAW
eukprot:COSAG01_NODE_2183_length_8208_cov_4.918486_9_plen_63_part_00